MGKEKKKKRRSSKASTESDSSSSDSSLEKEKLRRLKKKIKREKEKAKKMLKKAKKKKVKRSKSKSKSFSEDESSNKKKKDEATTDIPIELMEMSKVMAPMTKEEWEKKQSVVRRVLDEESGRYRLIKGDGEVIEEIVSRERHKEINKKATMADGEYFKSKMSVNFD